MRIAAGAEVLYCKLEIVYAQASLFDKIVNKETSTEIIFFSYVCLEA